jgi:hypothetical protein
MRISKLTQLALAALVLATVPSPARASADTALQSPGTSSAKGGRPGKQTWRVPRATGAIVVDGKLDDPAWLHAVEIPLTVETRPAENQPATVTTKVYLTYDDRFVYAAFRASDPDPGAIRARLADRDSAWDDDFVGVVLDTFNDERRAFEFFVNPLGSQMDLFNDDVNGNEDETWDAIWSSAGRITADGFEVEMAIPGSSLRFPAAAGAQTWGVDLLRFRPRVDRARLSSQALDRNVSCYICQFSKLEGFDGLTPGKNVELAPTLVAGRTDRRQDFPRGDLEAGDTDSELGFTARWGITPNLILNAAVNPDFSQVGADTAQLDVNTQFALFFPERRPFFLEGGDFFSSPFNAVFTRNVADPDWGVKLTGKQGANAMGVFVAEDALTNLLLPGTEGSRTMSLRLASTDAAVRWRRDLAGNSNLGVIATARSGDGYRNLLAGVDGRWQINEQNRIIGQVLSSRTDDPTSFGQARRVDFGGEALKLQYSLSSRNWYANARYEQIDPDFRADLGFIPRVGYDTSVAGGGHVWQGTEHTWYSRMELGGDWDRTEDSHGNLLEEEWEAWWEAGLPLQSYVSFDAGVRDRTYRGQTFAEQFLNVFVESRPMGDLYVNVEGHFGDDIDFANTSPTYKRAGSKQILSTSLTWKPGRRLRTSLSYEVNALSVLGGELFDARLTQLRVVYQLNLRTFVRLVTQYTEVSRDPTLYTFDVASRSQDLYNELLFSYKLNPQTVLFVGYSDGYVGSRRGEGGTGSIDQVDLTQTDRTFFIKLGYAWLP